MEIITDYLEFWQNKFDSILTYTVEHLLISFVVILLSVVVTIPLAIYMTKMKNEKLKSLIFNIANIFQTIPTVALLAIMIPLMGIGFAPAVTALVFICIASFAAKHIYRHPIDRSEYCRSGKRNGVQYFW